MDAGKMMTMRGKCPPVDLNVKNNFPSPAKYGLQDIGNQKHQKSAVHSFGKETRAYNAHAKEQKHKPGAGSYNGTLDLSKSAPSFGFGSSHRPDLGKKGVPGPGAYKVPVKIANVSHYDKQHAHKF